MVWQKDDFYIKIFCSIPNISTGIIIKSDSASFIVDPGDGILRDLNKELSASEIINISDIFISHGHHDHVGGLWSFLTYLSVMGRKKTLEVHYPAGCEELEGIISAFRNVYGSDILYKIKLNKITNPKSYQRNNIKIIPFYVNHKDIGSDGKLHQVPSLGFKYVYNGKSICYGGDTAHSDELIKHAKDSDLAIIEAGAMDDEETELHMTLQEAIDVGESAKEYFLVHIPE